MPASELLNRSARNISTSAREPRATPQSHDCVAGGDGHCERPIQRWSSPTSTDNQTHAPPPQSKHARATHERECRRAWRRCRAGPSDNAAGMLSADNQMHALPTQSHNSRVGGHARRTSTTTPGSRWKAVMPPTSAYGHGPRPSPCLLSRSRPCLLVAFTTHRTSAVARGPDPRRTAAATKATHDRRLIV